MVEQGLAQTQEEAGKRILAGELLVDDRPADKPGTPTPPTARLRLRGEVMPYVSRGGLKLAGALDHFGVQPAGRAAADLGASTGGFTDCLLQRGAARVFAVDVGYGQLAWRLRCDPRVVVMDRTNARALRALPEPIDLVVGDLSFIGLRLVLPAVAALLADGGEAVLLIKPQFEAEGEGLAPGGLVADPLQRAAIIEKVLGEAVEAGFAVLGTVDSSLRGARSGNLEALVHLRWVAR
jgi:23S rRNA (cytidine1920-2'-O)/16S rRNA (cytidine1409-2'-O)-methyltransferase